MADLIDELTRTATAAIITARGSPNRLQRDCRAESGVVSGVLTPGFEDDPKTSEDDPKTSDVSQQLEIAQQTISRLQRNQELMKTNLEAAKKASMHRKSALMKKDKEIQGLKASLQVMQTCNIPLYVV